MAMKEFVGKNKHELDTPCLVIDLDIIDDNIQKMQVFARTHGKQLRPHAKTHKCSIIARKQIENGAIGVCAAKISEAEGLVAQGIAGVLVTGPVVTDWKIKRLLDCLEKAPSLMVVVDNLENVKLLHDALRNRKLSLDVLLDIDVGLQRTGVSPDNALELARRIAGFHSLRLRGIQAYAGQVQHIKGYDARRQVSLHCMQKAAGVFSQLRKAGIPCEIFTGAGTGTYDIDVRVPDLTELQVGSYVLMDAEYMGIGSAQSPERFSDFRPALSLLTAVVSVNQKGFVTVDAGLKALYKHGGTPIVLSPHASGLQYDWFGDEYGRLSFQVAQNAPRLGDVIELVVSHCDPTINQFDCFYVTQSDKVVDTWTIDLRGKCQ